MEASQERDGERMAERAVQSAIEKLNYFLLQKDFFLVVVDERVRSLRNKLKRIHALLSDVDWMRRENEIVKLWVYLAYNTQNVIDSFVSNIAQQRGETSAGLISYQTTFARGIKDIPAIQDVGNKISDIERSLDEISSYRSQYGIDNIRACGEASTSSNQRQIQREKRAPIVEEDDMVGFEDETRTLLGRLIGGDMRRDVISITGKRGIGKTTLAKKVYDNVSVKKSFDFRYWKKVNRESGLRVYLPIFDMKRKKYLVVIDDIWRREDWDDLDTQFLDMGNGSRVLLRTRNEDEDEDEDVAKYADAQSTPLEIRYLSENESWALFCKKALLENTAPPFPDLGRKMVEKCKGLPLAIALLGGVLSRKDKSWNEWDKVLKSVEWWLHESQEDAISGILALSYHDLPHYLRPCFLYFGAFRENSEISADELIRMWIAEGFVQRRRREEMEDVAEDYLEELISRSMIQVAKRKSNGMVDVCHIHQLLRGLAISKAKEERFLDVYGNIEPTSPTPALRLAITSCDIDKCISLNSSTRHLRSVLDFSYNGFMFDFREEKLLLKILGGAFKFLRVMHLHSHKLKSLPDEIGYLIHSRYLCLDMPKLKCLPSSITRLSNLQTLDIQKTSVKKMLPDDIWKMEQIRHLVLCSNELSNGMQLHHLSNLQTLLGVKAGRWIKEGLEKLTNLRDLEIIGDLKKALSRSISKLVHLRSLSLLAKATIPAFESLSKHEHLYKMKLSGRLEKLPEPHVFPPNLTELHLMWLNLDRDPMGTLEKLPNLRTLILDSMWVRVEEDSYKVKEMVCSVGGFPLLDFLSIKLPELEEWRVEEGAMPNLRRLKICFCQRLKMLPDGLRHVTTVQELELAFMREEFKERVRENEGDDWFKIRHVPSLIFEYW